MSHAFDDGRPPADGGPELTEQIRELLDRESIRDCLLRYTRGVDRVDEELIRSAFFADAIDAHGTNRVGTIEHFLEWWLPQQGGREAAQHFVTNCSIETDGDIAHVETYFFCFIKHSDTDVASLSGGRYVDRFERRSGEWRIALRVVLSEWRSAVDASSTAELAGRAIGLGTRDRNDLVYRRPLDGSELRESTR